jgi:hypothetical protein
MFSKRCQPRDNLPRFGSCTITLTAKACHLELTEQVVEVVLGLPYEPERGSDDLHGPHDVGLPLR